MADPVRLIAEPDRCNQSVVENLRALLADAEAGNIVAVTGIVEFRGGSYQQFGSTTMSRLQTAGALLESAVARLGFQD